RHEVTCPMSPCGSVSQSAGWEVQRCWKNNIGCCGQKTKKKKKKRLHVEQYKLLWLNKLMCCIPVRSKEDYTRWRLPPLNPREDRTIDFNAVLVGTTPLFYPVILLMTNNTRDRGEGTR
uniref:Uncharacterized protein n=1 Tax=Equus asinus TaxID=9793 RepID=A0A8C4M7X0_EQUAS